MILIFTFYFFDVYIVYVTFCHFPKSCTSVLSPSFWGGSPIAILGKSSFSADFAVSNSSMMGVYIGVYEVKTVYKTQIKLKECF